jgi:hypothetical protein
VAANKMADVEEEAVDEDEADAAGDVAAVTEGAAELVAAAGGADGSNTVTSGPALPEIPDALPKSFQHSSNASFSSFALKNAEI